MRSELVTGVMVTGVGVRRSASALGFTPWRERDAVIAGGADAPSLVPAPDVGLPTAARLV